MRAVFKTASKNNYSTGAKRGRARLERRLPEELLARLEIIIKENKITLSLRRPLTRRGVSPASYATPGRAECRGNFLVLRFVKTAAVVYAFQVAHFYSN